MSARTHEIIEAAKGMNPMIRRCVAIAGRFENTNPDELRETLRWLDRQRKDLRVCWCNRDIYTQLAKVMRKVIREYN